MKFFTLVLSKSLGEENLDAHWKVFTTTKLEKTDRY